MRDMLYCYHGEIDGKKKVAIPRLFADKPFLGEYDIYTIEIEKIDGEIKPKYVLKHDTNAIYNRRNFNSKKYKFNSLNFKDFNTLERSHRVVIIELENKSAIYMGGKIVNEHPFEVEEGIFIEISRNYTFDDSPSYINQKLYRYMDEVKSNNKAKTKVEDEDMYQTWSEELLRIEDLGLENLNIDFLGQGVFSQGMSPKLLGYNDSIGIIVYEEGGAEQHIYETLKDKDNECIFGIVIYRDKVKILVNDSAFSIKKEMGWKDTIKDIVIEFTSKFDVKSIIILQQVKERILENNKKCYDFRYVIKSDTIFNN